MTDSASGATQHTTEDLFKIKLTREMSQKINYKSIIVKYAGLVLIACPSFSYES
jgi:hypothetical protein